MACDLLPPEAKPIDPPITTTSNPITTPAPTEPPGRKNLLFGYLTASKLTYGGKKGFSYYLHIFSTAAQKFSHSPVKTCNL